VAGVAAGGSPAKARPTLNANQKITEMNLLTIIRQGRGKTLSYLDYRRRRKVSIREGAFFAFFAPLFAHFAVKGLVLRLVRAKTLNRKGRKEGRQGRKED